jgi:hypothetical protein
MKSRSCQTCQKEMNEWQRKINPRVCNGKWILRLGYEHAYVNYPVVRYRFVAGRHLAGGTIE